MNLFSYKLSGTTDPILFIIFIVLPTLTAGLCLFYAIRFLKRARTLEDIPKSKIRSAAQGYVALTGVVSPLLENAMLGALSKKPCTWYRYIIQGLAVYRTDNETVSRWETLQQGASQEYFILNDGTGDCIISPPGAAIITTSTLRWYGNTPIPTAYPKPSFWNLLFGTSGQYCYIEERLENNTEAYATGMFYTVGKDSDVVQQNPNLKSYLEAKNKNTVHILNNEGLGQKQSLLVSAIPERKVVREYRIKAFVFFLAFLFFAIMTVTSSYRTVMMSVQDWDKQQGSASTPYNP